ncbi:MAG: OmpA family protein [Desulfamplus sp.]|nr:OmpA family protein [Desulfamplus sp.]MBF0412920.1 OmpA family protein [Desulfamplus sp.]
MNTYNKNKKQICLIRYKTSLFIIISALLIINGCASGPIKNTALERAREAYQNASITPEVASNAPVALYDAKQALDKAERAARARDRAETEHLSYLAERKAELAVLLSESKKSETAISELSVSKDKILLKAREQESDAARAAAEQKAREAEQKAREAELAKQHSEEMMRAAEKSRLEAEAALAQKLQLEKELAELHAEMTDRGAVVTLGNILFEVNKSRLLQGGLLITDKLANFLKKYPKRKMLIEGHTDSRGSDSYNLGLSNQRAIAVFSALMERGIDSERMITKGYGEQYPIAGNDTEAGRQQNRRVEAIILDEGVSPEQKFR